MSFFRTARAFGGGFLEGIRDPVGTVIKIATDDPRYGFQLVARELAADAGFDIDELTDDAVSLRVTVAGRAYTPILTNRGVLCVCGRLAVRPAGRSALRDLVGRANRAYPAYTFDTAGGRGGEVVRGFVGLGEQDGAALRAAVCGLVPVVAAIDDAADRLP